MRFSQYLCTIATLAICSAAYAAPSTFQKSCTDIKLSEDATKITANCKKMDGTSIPASLDLGGVENIDGKLTKSGKKTTFQQSCNTSNLGINDKHVHLTAICKKEMAHRRIRNSS